VQNFLAQPAGRTHALWLRASGLRIKTVILILACSGVLGLGLGTPALSQAAQKGEAPAKPTPAKPALAKKAAPARAKADQVPPAKVAAGTKKPVAVKSAKTNRAPVARLGKAQTGKVGARPSRLKTAAARPIEPAKPSIGQAIGLHAADDPLDLKSSVALVIDQSTGKVLFEKNSTAVLPIASITKLMTAVVVLDAKLPLGEPLLISEEDIDTERNSRSRLRVGSQLSRGELLQLALMASENRAAHALGRHYPGGMPAFVGAMNAKARALGMADSHFVEPTGLSSANVSTGSDLALLVKAAGEYPMVRQYSTAPDQQVESGSKTVNYRNTNRLISSPDWQILVSKTGYISEAGNCLVMQARVEGRAVIMVLLDAVGRLSRFSDAQRLRTVLAQPGPGKLPQTGSGS
jgi:serine-type D-Ala-D-Ala endopeptidase (penicillin-binding protein 7)